MRTLLSIARDLPPPVKKQVRLAYRVTYSPSYYLRLRKPKSSLKLHLGCGKRRFPGFINIDMHWSPAVDYKCDIAKLPCPDNTVSRIETYHVIEHIPRPQVKQVMREWYRILEPSGILVMECPDFREAVKEWLAGNEERMYSIFGRQRFPGDAHHWGYTVETLAHLAREIGFTEVNTPPAEDYHAQKEQCIRVEAAK